MLKIVTSYIPSYMGLSLSVGNLALQRFSKESVRKWESNPGPSGFQLRVQKKKDVRKTLIRGRVT